METDNKPLIFVVIFFILCLSLIGGVWYSLYALSTYREEYDLLASERDSFSSNMERLKAKKAALEQINSINFTHSEKASDTLEFYSRVRDAADKNHVEMISMTATQAQNISEQSGSVLTIKMRGGYYDLAKVFADWRQMPFASRVKSLRLARDKTDPEEAVEADIVLEAYTE